MKQSSASSRAYSIGPEEDTSPAPSINKAITNSFDVGFRLVTWAGFKIAVYVAAESSSLHQVPGTLQSRQSVIARYTCCRCKTMGKPDALRTLESISTHRLGCHYRSSLVFSASARKVFHVKRRQNPADTQYTTNVRRFHQVSMHNLTHFIGWLATPVPVVQL